MKLTLTILSFALLAMFVNITALAQDNSDPRWNQSPSTKLYVTGEYSLPKVENNVKRDLSTRLYHTSMGDFLVPANIRPYPSTATQSEINAVTQFGNQNVMYAAWNSYYPSFYGTGFCLTTNGGTSSTGNYQMIVSANNGDPGPCVSSTGSPNPNRQGISVIGNAGIYCTYTTEWGTTWTPFVNAGGSSTDKNLSAVDETTGSPFLGRAYTVWTDFGGTYVNRIMGAYSSNGGVSWTGYQPVSPVPPSGHHMQGCDVDVGPGGVVYVVWATCTTNGQNSTEDYLGFAKSTDGGVSWPVSNYNVVDVNGIRQQYYYNNFRVAGFPRLSVDHSGGARNGWIYVTLCEKLIAPARDNGDATLCRSTDGGTTWTHTLVNGDASGAYQYFSCVRVDQSNGNVAVGYYDTRGLTAPNAQYYVSWSNNGGNTWVDVLASDHTFIPTPISGLATGYQGDYTGITYSNNKFWPFWADNSSGIYQCWTVGIQTIQLAHDIQMGPFLSFPGNTLIVNTPYTIKGKVSNVGTSTESGTLARWYINGTLTNTTTFATLTAGQSDSASNSWTPTSVGSYVLKYISVQGTDTNRTNDTLQTTVNVVTTIPSMCPFSCLSAASYTAISGSAGPTGDDAGIDVPIGFSFMWKGTTYTNAWICTNGFIELGTTGTTTYVNDLASTGDINMIAGFWDDLYVTTGGNIQYTTQGTAPNRIFIVQYTTVAFLASTSNNVTFQIRLYENSGSSQAEIIYGPSTPYASATGSVGINVTPGGSGNFTSITPGSSGCSNTTYSTTTANNSLPSTYLTSGTHYGFCWFVGVQHEQNTVPSVYSLSQNYPNPFNPETKINYALPKAGLVKIVVYDLLGAEITTLVNENKTAGNYSVTFNGSNLASGVYFYKITAGDFTDVKKMLLVK